MRLYQRYRTPLFVSIAHSTDYNISRLLIDKGADINHSCIDGSGPLHTFFNDVFSRVILCHGEYLEANTKNSVGRTVLHYLAWSSRSKARDARACLSDISAITAQDDDGRIPLHYAARRGNIELVKYFLKLMSVYDMNRADCNGQTAFHYAAESRRVDVMNELQKGRMNILRKDQQHRSVLHQAALHGNVEAVKRVLALAGERELEAKDVNGMTPFHLAHHHGAHPVVNYLRLEYGLSLGADAAKTTGSGSRLTPGCSYRWKKVVDRGMDSIMSPATVAVFVVCLAVYLSAYMWCRLFQ